MPRPIDTFTRYRLRETPPIRFQLWGAAWEIVVEPMAGTGGSRAHLKGPKLYYLTGGAEENIARRLMVEGIEIHDRSPVGSVFRHLEREGLVERVHSADNSTAARR